jgi:hypothetical protein
MSLHSKPEHNNPVVIEGLKLHKLPHDTPSQLADAFRNGFAHADRAQCATPGLQLGDALDAARYRWLRNKALGFDQIGSSTPYVVRGQVMDTLDGARLDSAVDRSMGLTAAVQPVEVRPSESGCVACAACGYPVGQAGVSCGTCEPAEVQRVGLAKDQIIDATCRLDVNAPGWIITFTRAIERAHGIKPAGEKVGES